MISRSLIIALLVALSGGQYAPSGPHFPLGSSFNPCLISGWPMNEGSGGVLHDVSGNSNTANVGGFTWQSNAGLPGTTILWSASTSATSTNTALTNFPGTTPFSVSFWANPTSTGVYLGNLDASGVDRGWEVSQDASNILKLLIVNTFPGNRLDVTAPLTINTGLHYVVVTADGGSGGFQQASGIKVYIDGVSQTVSVTANTLSATSASGLPITFGQRGFSLHLNGAMAFDGVYNCVLTSTQVATFNGLGPRIN